MTEPRANETDKSSLPVGRDIARFGFAIALTVALGAVQVFVLPRRLEIATYGEYRLFMVYVAYVGLLHLGLADGAFVRWAGESATEIRREWTRVFFWMLGLESAVLVLALIASLVMRDSITAAIVLAIGACALFVNLSTLSGYALQAAADFRGAGIVAVIGPAGFVAAILLLPLSSLNAVLAAYAGTMGISALVGAILVARLHPAASDRESNQPISLVSLLHKGRHVLGSNLAAGLAQSVDRILVTLFVPMTGIALYGFASSVSVAGISATQTMQRVALSHAAHRHGDERAKFFGRFYDLTLMAYGLALVGVPFFEHAVTRALPAYVPALSMVRAFVAGAPFWIALHVVVVGTLQSHHHVKTQFAVELGGAAIVATVCGVCLAIGTPLWVVATAASIAAVVSWGIGVLALDRVVPAAKSQGALRFLGTCAVQCAAMGVAFSASSGWMVQTAIYAGLAGVPTLVAIRGARAALRND